MRTAKVRRLTREESRALTRSRLLASAREVIAREGYEGASVDKIAEEAGFSKGAFYSNFESKEEIVLELLETHSMDDVKELTVLLKEVTDVDVMIKLLTNWSAERSKDPSWGLLALELFRRARRDATFSTRHARLFRAQWKGIGRLILGIMPKPKRPMNPEIVGAMVAELTYGAASSFSDGPAPSDLVRTILTALACQCDAND